MGDGDLSPRKVPTQRRSRQTLEDILAAGARVFAQRGFAGGSTNRIAEVAGVSIGSLYEYFPNKEAILVALATRELERMIADLQAVLDRASENETPLERWLCEFVTEMLSVHERDPELHRVVFAEAAHPPELHACVLQMEEQLAHAVEPLLARAPELSLRDCDTAAHFVVQTAEALAHRYVHHGIHGLARSAFVEELVLLLRGYLAHAAEH